MSYVFKFNEMLLINHGSNQKTSYVRYCGDVTALYNSKDENIGYNIKHECDCEHQGLVVKPCENLQKIINEKLNKAGFESITLQGCENIVVGKVLTCVDHPDSDHLHITTVDVKDEVLQIVCGAKNVKEGIKVVVAKVGAMMFDGTFIAEGNLRNVKSYGMICSGYELNMEGYQKGQGILILDDSYEIGSSFLK